jgi:short-subunit dehydrogenase
VFMTALKHLFKVSMKIPTPSPPVTRHILITGASSGLGAALARHYASSYRPTLYLQGRNLARLNHVAQSCRALGAKVIEAQIDVQDSAAMHSWISTLPCLELVIANAGISAATMALPARSHENAPQSLDVTQSALAQMQQAKEICATNIMGVFHTLYPALALMQRQAYGHLVLISSLAGYNGMAGASAYSASKAAILVFGQALRQELAPLGIKVSVVCPGFIDTPLTRRNPFKMPALMSAEKAAALIERRLRHAPARIAFPWPMVLGSWLLRTLPAALSTYILARLPRKTG